MKKMITYFLIIAVIFLIFTSLFKLFKNINVNKSIQFKNNNSLLYNIPKAMKYDYFIFKGSWDLYKESFMLIIGNKYYLLHSINGEDICYLGLFFLNKNNNNNLYFKSDKTNYTSKMFKYSNMKSLKLVTIIVNFNDIEKIKNIQNCSEWIKY
ncbi:hypothetical protein [Silvanigrella sp.]|jgi:hypothetical protein|uniref:hypothetical protein n=1 Tax=Silvanigrella sp. TaxID=2024976 RepID=UPI0037C88359